MGKLSLIGMALSLMLLGIFTFGAGFLVALWFFGTGPSAVPMMAQQYPSAVHPSQMGGYGSQLAQGAESIGFSNIAAQQAAIAAQQMISGANIPGVPSVLSPLVTQTQFAVGQEASNVASMRARDVVNQATQGALQGTMQGMPASPQGSPSPYGPGLQPLPHASSSSPAHGSPGPQSHRGADGSTDPKNQQFYTIRLGEFVAEENATNLVSELQDYSYPASVSELKDSDGQPLYVVDSGHFASEDMAREAARRLASINFPRALIVPLPKKEGQS